MESDRHLGPITWPAWLYVLVFYVLPMTLDLVIYAGDLVTDLRVAHLHYLNDSPSWGFWTVFFVFLPAILCFVVCVYRLFSKHSDEVPYVLKWMAIYIVCVFFFPLYPIFRYLRVLPYALMAMCSDRNREENLLQCKEPSQAKTFRFLEAFLESTPQFILQAIILLKSKESNLILETTQLQAMIFSLLSIAMTVITYEQDAKEEGRALTKHKVLPQEKKRKDPWQSETPEEHEEREVVAEEARVNLLEKVLRFIAWLLLLTGRLFALALFASIFYYYFFVLAAVHMIAVTVYLVLKTPVDLDFKTIIIFIFFSFISLC
ncbi:unnamed protein product [Darwinula stevensoni]|uniref:XK-related protein n=1 Tax=Darwinula stevensoni TaxID=69355 RepID=A0A7R9A094_9CRUS|nr:unnamed protein product [Darwinula stevensoni]CAG0884149.1 unnamed protein product [Darwinula stevensoni]